MSNKDKYLQQTDKTMITVLQENLNQMGIAVERQLSAFSKDGAYIVVQDTDTSDSCYKWHKVVWKRKSWEEYLIPMYIGCYRISDEDGCPLWHSLKRNENGIWYRQSWLCLPYEYVAGDGSCTPVCVVSGTSVVTSIESIADNEE